VQATYLTALDISLNKGEEGGATFSWKVFQATPALASIEVFPQDSGTQLGGDSLAIDQCCFPSGRYVEFSCVKA